MMVRSRGVTTIKENKAIWKIMNTLLNDIQDEWYTYAIGMAIHRKIYYIAKITFFIKVL